MAMVAAVAGWLCLRLQRDNTRMRQQLALLESRFSAREKECSPNDDKDLVASPITSGVTDPAPTNTLPNSNGSESPEQSTVELENVNEPMKGYPLAKSRIARTGLTQGTRAPNFRLPHIEHGELSLDQYIGRKVLLVFSSPDCGPCNLLAPALENLARRTPDIQVIMVSRGDREANQLKAKEHGLTFPIVLQRHWEISRSYAMFATPIAYFIDEQGIIVANVAIGPVPILNLLVSSAILSLLDARRVFPLKAQGDA